MTSEAIGRVAAAALVAALLGCGEPGGRLELALVDAATGEPAAARVELLDAGGAAHLASGALAVAGDCGWLPLHTWLGRWAAAAQMGHALSPAVRDHYAGADHFYVDGTASARLAPGRYRLRVFKGIAYRMARRELEVRDGETTRVRVELERWVDLPAEGWAGGDGHLHIARPAALFDARIARWLEAEDLEVGNLLQMGFSRTFDLTVQRGFGDPSVYRRGGTLIASGQESPRTHLFGHVILLGADRWVDFPASYLAYDRFWREGRRRGGINGYAHGGLSGGDEALAVWGGEELLDFVEVLGLGLHYYGLWYELLDMGFAVAPVAGTDYPCGPGLPGRERLYARVEEGWSYRDWLESVRRGRTFVTNGPVLDLEVAGAGGLAKPGEELALAAPAEVQVFGRARFDPERERVERLELVGAGGRVLASGLQTGPGELLLELSLPVERSSWLALRASGVKRGEVPVEITPLTRTFLDYLEEQQELGLVPVSATVLPAEGGAQLSAAHTGAVWISVEGTPPLGEQPRARRLAAAWLARLDRLEGRLGDEGIASLAGFPGRGDGMTGEDLLANRSALLSAIAAARADWHDGAADHPHGAATDDRRPGM